MCVRARSLPRVLVSGMFVRAWEHMRLLRAASHGVFVTSRMLMTACLVPAAHATQGAIAESNHHHSSDQGTRVQYGNEGGESTSGCGSDGGGAVTGLPVLRVKNKFLPGRAEDGYRDVSLSVLHRSVPRETSDKTWHGALSRPSPERVYNVDSIVFQTTALLVHGNGWSVMTVCNAHRR